MYKFLIPLVALAILLVGCSPAASTTEGYATSSAALSQADTASSAPSSAPSSLSSTSTMSASTSTFTGPLLTGKHSVTLKTSKGDITVELDASRAPKAATNFFMHAKDGYYTNLTFHRVISGFMIQGGDPTGTGRGGESIFGDSFEDEIKEPMTYAAGTLAMANAGPNTNGSQFFIMQKDYPLPPNYTIFGHVTKGQNVVDAIAKVPRDSENRPLEPVTFTAVAGK